MKIKASIVSTLGSKYTLYSLLASWIVVIIFSNFVLPPSDDGKTYFEPALGFLYGRVQWGDFMGDEFNPGYSMFPTFSFFQFIFFYITSLFKIPINFYTYRMFHMFLVLTLILLSVYLLFLYFRKIKNSDYIIKSNVFIILLSITPFAQNCWQVRPEIFGSVLIITSLIFYVHWELTKQKNLTFYYLCALFMGLSATVHPNISIIACVITLSILLINIKKGNLFSSFAFGAVAVIPVFILVSWYLAFYPESVMEFKLNMIGHKGFLGGIRRLIEEALMLGAWKSMAIKAFYFMFWFPFLVVILATTALVFKKVKKLTYYDNFNHILVAIYVSVILLMIINRGDDSYFVIFSCFISLVFVSLLRFEEDNSGYQYNERFLYKYVLISLVFLVFLHTSVHITKRHFSSEKYYFAPRTYKIVKSSLKAEDTLFITKSRQVACFIDLLEAKYRGDHTSNNIFIVFAEPKLDYDKIKLRLILMNKVKSITHDSTVWGVWKNNTNFDRENMKLIYRYEYQPKKSNPLRLYFDVKTIIYEDKDHLFIRPEMIAFEGDIL